MVAQSAENILNLFGNTSTGEFTVNLNAQLVRLSFEQQQERFAQTAYAVPIFSDKLVDRMLVEGADRILLVGGRPGFDKQKFITYLGYLLAQSNGPEPIDVLPLFMWKNSLELSGILVEIQKKTAPAIFLIPSLISLKEDFLSELNHLIKENGGYVILSCEDPERLSLSIKAKSTYCYSLDVETQLFSVKQIADRLCEKFTSLGFHNRFHQSIQRFDAKTVLDVSEVYTVEGLAEELKYLTLEQAGALIDSLSSTTNKLDRSSFSEAISKEVNTQFEQWILSLEEREQLIVLGMLLLDGLQEDQFFATMQILIDRGWHWLDEKLRAFDYFEVFKLNSFFSLESETLTNSLPNREEILAKTFWRTHKRHILSALEVLKELVYFSVSTRSAVSHPELFKTITLRDNFCYQMARTFSDIGLVSEETIQDILIGFAINPDEEIQLVAARTLAFWKLKDNEERVFNTLDLWQDQEGQLVFTLIANNLQVEDSESQEEIQQLLDAITAVNSTTALTLGELADLYPANELPEELIARLKHIADYGNDEVIKRLKIVLPDVVAKHIVQLQTQGHIKALLAYSFLTNEIIGPLKQTVLRNGSKRYYYDGGIIYAIQTYRANAVPKVVLDLIDYLLADERKQLVNHQPNLIFQLVFSHLDQIKNSPILIQGLKNRKRLEALAIAVAGAARTQHQAAEFLMKRWYGLAFSHVSVKQRRVLKELLVLVYRHLDLEKCADISIPDVFERLTRILKEDIADKNLRSNASEAVEHQIQLSFPKVKTYLSRLLVQLSLKEQENLNYYFLQRFLEERAQLQGEEMMAYYWTDARNVIQFQANRNKSDSQDLHPIPMWIDTDAPTTELEQTLAEWMVYKPRNGVVSKEESAILNQIGAKAKTYLGQYFQKQEEDFRKRIKDRRKRLSIESKEAAKKKVSLKPTPSRPAGPPPTIQKSESASWFMKTIINYMNRNRESELRPILKAVLPVYLNDPNMTQEDLSLQAKRLALDLNETTAENLPIYIKNAKREYFQIKNFITIIIIATVVILGLILFS